MSVLCYAISLSLLAWMGEAQLNFNYLRQDQWGYFCNLPSSKMQSPINILTEKVVENQDIIPLEFDNRWTDPADGNYRNDGINIGFFPDGEDGTRPTLRNHLGVYEHLQFHMHWGNGNNIGTAHEIDGVQYGVEFHWVNTKLNSNFSFATATNESNRDSLSVLAVLAEANDSMPLTGVWAQLDPTRVINYTDSSAVTALSYSDLLPESRDFYYTPGGFTSPPCLEIVHWFVLKEKIQIPSAYIDRLRMMQFDDDTLMLTNHRDAQPLNDRTVYTVPAGAAKQAASLVALMVSMLSVWLTILFSEH